VERCQILVAVPARNESTSVAACIESIDLAARYVGNDVTVVLAADTCTDATAQIARTAEVTSCRLSVIEGRWGTAGATRAAAVNQGLAQLGGDASAAWIANTDADCVVPSSWLRLQATMAWSVDAIGGIVQLDPNTTDRRLLDAFAASYPLDGDHHPHVHGANIGVSAKAYRTAGGWCTTTQVGEDHLLWNALVAGGCRVVQAAALRVFTSARVNSRVVGGFATNLEQLHPELASVAHV
jgi:glycosyltransferase involved in cell wall biosynthesis